MNPESLRARHRDLGLEIADPVEQTGDAPAELRLSISAENARAFLGRLVDEAEGEVRRLVDLTVIDRGETRASRFEVVYRLESLDRQAALRVHVPVDGVDPVVDSVVALWPAANWLEREALDLFGITFRGHPDPRRLLLEPDFKGSPLRKDADLGGGNP